jgi:nucleoside-diphosphate-sugar epimerase
MNVLVTGSRGFIGRHVARALVARGATVTGWDVRPPAEAEPGYRSLTIDLLDRARVADALAALAPDAVVHLAARTDLDGRTPAEYAVNVDGVRYLAEAIRRTPSVRRVICTSSQLVCRVGYHPANEHDYAPSTAYGESKVLTERIWRERDGGGPTWCLVRPTTIWGPGMNPHYLRFFRMIRDGRYVHVGRGPTFKSYGYVGNTAHQYLRLLEVPDEAIARRVFYLADYEPIALEAWAEAFRAALDAPPIRTIPLGTARVVARVGDAINRLGGRRFPFNSFRLNNVLTAYLADLAPTRAVCGELPYTMLDGVAETVRWLREVWGAAPAGAGTAPAPA